MELKYTQTSDSEEEMEQKGRYMMVKLPEGVETDKQIKERAIDVRTYFIKTFVSISKFPYMISYLCDRNILILLITNSYN